MRSYAILTYTGKLGLVTGVSLQRGVIGPLRLILLQQPSAHVYLPHLVEGPYRDVIC